MSTTDPPPPFWPALNRTLPHLGALIEQFHNILTDADSRDALDCLHALSIELEILAGDLDHHLDRQALKIGALIDAVNTLDHHHHPDQFRRRLETTQGPPTRRTLTTTPLETLQPMTHHNTQSTPLLALSTPSRTGPLT